MFRSRSHWLSIGLGFATAFLVLLATACTGEAGSPMVSAIGPESGTWDESSDSTMLTAEEAAELEARAMARVWSDSTNLPPVCASAEASPELRDAIAAAFSLEGEYFGNIEDILTDTPGTYRCTVVSPRLAQTFRAGVVGVDVWATRANLSGGAQTCLFRWDGSEWVDTTADETGVTVTTAVS